MILAGVSIPGTVLALPLLRLWLTSIDEPDPYRTHWRLELSWLDAGGREVFRALYIASSRANPVLPSAFGAFELAAGSVEGAGQQGAWEVTIAGFSVLPEIGLAAAIESADPRVVSAALAAAPASPRSSSSWATAGGPDRGLGR